MPDYCNLLHVLSDDTILSDRDKLVRCRTLILCLRELTWRRL